MLRIVISKTLSSLLPKPVVGKNINVENRHEKNGDVLAGFLLVVYDTK